MQFILFKKCFSLPVYYSVAKNCKLSVTQSNKHLLTFYICGLAGLAEKALLNVVLTFLLGWASRLGQALLIEWQKLKGSRGDVSGISRPTLPTPKGQDSSGRTKKVSAIWKGGASKAGDHLILFPTCLHLIKTFDPYPLGGSHSPRLLILTSWVHMFALLNLLCFAKFTVLFWLFSNPFLCSNKNLDPGIRPPLTSLGAAEHQTKS